MPSKGVHVYTYIAVPECSIELSVPKQQVVRKDLRRFRADGLEVESSNIDSFFDKRGRFTFKVIYKGDVITEQWTTVNAITGDAKDGTLTRISDTPAILHRGDLIVCYGFYEAGSGKASLPNRHQCYITVTPNHANWMGNLAPPGSEAAQRPFRCFALPSPHDAGMNSMDSTNSVLGRVGGAVIGTLVGERFRKSMTAIANAISGKAIEKIAPNIVYGLAITQKDSLGTMLALGARYFEFRPARCHEAILPSGAIPDRLYFQHSAIPGMGYEQFLCDVVDFLLEHPQEIIVVQIRWDGVPPECKRPDKDEQQEYIDIAMKGAGDRLCTGTLTDLRNCTTDELRSAKKRLIMLVNVKSLSTYTDAGNATLNGDSIVDAFAEMLIEKNHGRGIINIQCQATATNITEAVVYSVMSSGSANSCLMATKAICDSKTLPWIRDHAAVACGEKDLLVLMNDFLDGATVDVAIELSKQRLHC